MVTPVWALAGAISLASAGPSLEETIETSDISGVSLSPDGRQVAFRTERASLATDDYRIEWWVAPLDGRAPARRIGDGGGAQFTGSGILDTQTPLWSPDSKAIYYRALGQNGVQVWRADVDGSDARAMTNEPGNVRDLRAENDGSILTYRVGPPRDALEAAERANDQTGVLVDASVDLAQPVIRGAWIDGHAASQRFDGHWFDRGTLLWQAPLEARTMAILPSDEARRDRHRLGRTRPGLQPGIETVHELPTVVATAPGIPTRVCRSAPCQRDRAVAAVPIPGRADILITTSDTAHAQTLSLWNPDTRRVRIVARSKGLLSGGHDPDAPCAVDHRSMVCVEATPSSPPRLLAIDLVSGRQRVLADPNDDRRGPLPARVERLDWKGSTGTSYSGQLVLPVTPRPASGFPLVVNYYTCPGYLRGGLGDELPFFNLAAAGIAALCITAPFHATARDAASRYAEGLDGVATILAQLSSRGLVDRHHVGMWGLSFGSEVTSWVLSHTQLLAAASLSSTILEPQYYWYYGDPNGVVAANLAAHWKLGAPDTDAGRWANLSPALMVDRVTAPVLLQMPEQEARISMQYVTGLRRAGKPVELYAFGGEAHILERPRHRLAAYARNRDWFRFWLQDAQDPDATKAEQYRRWNAMAGHMRSPERCVMDMARP